MREWWNKLDMEHKVAVFGIGFLLFIVVVTAPL